MGLLNDQLALDAAEFVNLDVFGETVTYTPRNGSAVSIEAVVVREIPQPLESNSQTALYGKTVRVIVFIRNHATEGRTSIDIGGDKITLARRLGDTAEALSVMQVMEQDEGMWKLLLR